MENSLEQIQLSVPEDGRYHLRCYFPPWMDKYTRQALFSIPVNGKYNLCLASVVSSSGSVIRECIPGLFVQSRDLGIE